MKQLTDEEMKKIGNESRELMKEFTKRTKKMRAPREPELDISELKSKVEDLSISLRVAQERIDELEQKLDHLISLGPFSYE